MSTDILFTCPRCGASHRRGFVDGVCMFRCLGCGYLGRGNHPDPDIDAEIGREMDEAEAWNAAHGIPSTPIAERRP